MVVPLLLVGLAAVAYGGPHIEVSGETVTWETGREVGGLDGYGGKKGTLLLETNPDERLAYLNRILPLVTLKVESVVLHMLKNCDLDIIGSHTGTWTVEIESL